MDELASAFETIRVAATKIIAKGAVNTAEYRLAVTALQLLTQFASAVAHENRLAAFDESEMRELAGADLDVVRAEHPTSAREESEFAQQKRDE